MADSENFVDYVKICCRSGAGGAGSMHFHRDKMTAKGGPDGGDGGRGGHIILKGNAQLWTLLHLKYRKHVIAEAGGAGAELLKTGAEGKDEILEVPLGTVARDAETGVVECEITEDGQTVILVRGGKGGRGNWNYRTPTNQTPEFTLPPQPGKDEWKILELKVLADVGLVGFPNAGKSTLLAAVSAAKPKIGDYAFTTLTPNLGMIRYRDDRSFIMADIPGIIEDAHKGKGLGHRFLRHIERNAVLLFMIPCDSPNIKAEYEILLNELHLYNPQLLDKPRLLAITKCDMMDQELEDLLRPELPVGPKTIFISAVSGKNIDRLKDLIWSELVGD